MTKNEIKITIPMKLPGLDEALEKAREINTILRSLNVFLNNVAPEHNGCEGCAFEECSDREEPCLKCRHNYVDKYRQR